MSTPHLPKREQKSRKIVARGLAWWASCSSSSAAAYAFWLHFGQN